MEFKDRLALITGGTGAIGSAVASELASRGANVALVYRSNEERARKVADSIPGSVNLFRCDVGDPGAVKALAGDVREKCGDVTILVHAAGTRADGALLMMSDDQWREVLRTNLDGGVYCARAFLRDMIARRQGAVVLISSASALRAVPGQTNYSAANAGLIGLTRSLSAEVGRYGIRVNTVAPGLIETDMTGDLKPEERDRLLRGSALQRAGSPEEVAHVVAFLAGDQASYITGQVLSVDGGIG